MNQILDFGAGGGNDNNNYNRKEKKPEKKEKEKVEYNNYDNNVSFSGGGDSRFGGKTKEKMPMSDKVVKVFAILMVILAIALIASGATSILKNKKDTTAKQNANKQTAPAVQAEINAELDEIEGKVTITVESPVAIAKMIYSWDQDHDNVVSGKKQTSLEEKIIAQSGEHVLHIQVTDEQDNKTTKDFTFNCATGIDTSKPEITLTITEDKKLLVNATDDTSIAYVTYTWNEGETITMTPETEGLKEFEFEVDIPKGKNTIVVIAVDGSESGNARSTSKVLDGVTKPEINYGFLDSEGAVLKIMCSHENGIQKIYYTLNGQPYQWEVAEGEEAPKYLEFTQESVPGKNEMTIKVTSVDETEAEFNPLWEYNAPVPETPVTPVTEETTSLQEGETTTENTETDTSTTEPTEGETTENTNN